MHRLFFLVSYILLVAPMIATALPQGGMPHVFKGHVFHEVAHEKRAQVLTPIFAGGLEVWNPMKDPARFELLSADGRAVLSGRLVTGQNNIDAANMESGGYLLVINSLSGTEIHQVIKGSETSYSYVK